MHLNQNEISTHQHTNTTAEKYAVIAFVLFCLSLLLYMSVQLTKSNRQLNAIDDIAYFVDYSGDYNLQGIIELEPTRWQRSSELNFFANPNPTWLKVEVSAQSNSLERLIKFQDPLINLIEVWVFTKSNGKYVKRSVLGDTFEYDNREVKTGSLVASLGDLNEELTVFIRAESNFFVNLNLTIWSAQDFVNHNGNMSLFYGAIFGYAFATFAFSLLMVATTKRPEYSFYTGYLASFSFLLASLSGFGFQYLWPQNIDLQGSMSAISLNAMMFCLIAFTISLLSFSSEQSKHRLLLVLHRNAFIVLTGLSILISHTAILQVSVLLFGLCIVSMFIIMQSLAKQKVERAVFFVYVWGVLLITILLVILERANVSPFNLDPVFAIVIGFCVETLLIGAALVNIYRLSKQRAEQHKLDALDDDKKAVAARDELLAIQEKSKVRLEEQVRQQTAKLESALLDLSKASSELKQLRNIDGLTELPNRFMFEERMHQLVVSSSEDRVPIGLAVIDLDHFKSINDTHGHAAGDRVLKAFATLLKQFASEHDFDVCRFGGEEFLMVGYNQTSAQMHKYAEHFRKQFEQFNIEVSGEQKNFTFSAGIHSQILEHDNHFQLLLAKADAALYNAKQNGRNQVVSAA